MGWFSEEIKTDRLALMGYAFLIILITYFISGMNVRNKLEAEYEEKQQEYFAETREVEKNLKENLKDCKDDKKWCEENLFSCTSVFNYFVEKEGEGKLDYWTDRYEGLVP